MSLTALELAVDQSRPGWLPRAAREAAALLSDHGRPQMALAAREAFRQKPDLATLQHFVRLAVTPGEATAHWMQAAVDTSGPLDGNNAASGLVPRQPAVAWLQGARKAIEAWHLVAGDALLIYTRLGVGKSGHIGSHHPVWLHPGAKGTNLRPGWQMRSEDPLVHAASDGERVLLLQQSPRSAYFLHLVDAASGQPLWRKQTPLSVQLGMLPPKAVLGDGLAIFCNSGGGLVAAYDAETGGELWRTEVPSTRGHVQVRLLGSSLCLLRPCGGLDVLDLRSGALRWSHKEWPKGYQHFWGDEEYLYLGGDSTIGARCCLASGEPVQIPLEPVSPASDGRMSASARIGDATLLGRAGCLLAVGGGPRHPVLWKRTVPGYHIGELHIEDTLVRVVGDAVIHASMFDLSAYRLKDGEPLWENLTLPHIIREVSGHPAGLVVSFHNGAVALIREKD